MADKDPGEEPRAVRTARVAVGQLAGRMRERLSRISPARLLVLSFACAILAGTLLLWLPFSHRGNVGPLEALFTATSAVCVTGLIVVDTGTDFVTVHGVFFLTDLSAACRTA